MKNQVFPLLILFASLASAQQSFDSSFPFETELAKKFSIYVPSSYDGTTPHKIMLAFHPTTMNAISWRNDLIDFAENSDLLLVCPDGGKDTRVDDPLDYRFTSALLDSVRSWYATDASGLFAMGFGVGGKAMYEYGLENAKKFSGFIPVGPEINGTTELSDLLSNALCKPFYLVQGQNDDPATRYAPIKAALEQNKAEVNFILMAGVGHTFNFPNRESILKAAFNWIDTVVCKTSTGIRTNEPAVSFQLFPTVVSSPGTLYLGIHLKSPEVLTIEVWSMDGRLVYNKRDSFQESNFPISLNGLESGMYVLNVFSSKGAYSEKFMVK